MSSEVQLLTTEELASLGLLQMSQRTEVMITESRAISRSIDAALATVASDPNLSPAQLAEIFGDE